MVRMDEGPDIITCRQAGLLYEQILTGQPFPLGRWAADQAVAITKGRFPPQVAVTDREWLHRMRLLANIVDAAARERNEPRERR